MISEKDYIIFFHNDKLLADLEKKFICSTVQSNLSARANTCFTGIVLLYTMDIVDHLQN